MKKISIAMIMCCFSCIAYAQEFRGGVKGGLNLSNLYIDEINDEKARVGFHAGLFGQMELSEAFAIQPEIMYSTKGAKANYDVIGFEGENKLNLNYIEVPVLAVFKIGENFEIHAGPYVSYLLNAKFSTEGDLGNGVEDLDKDHLTEADFGLSGGIALGSETTKVGLRYNYGLVEIADSDVANTILRDAKNSALQLFVSFGF